MSEEVEFDFKEVSQRMLSCLLRKHKCLNSSSYVPFWSIVGKYTGHGSGYSAQLCKQLGFDPEAPCNTRPRR